MLETIMCTTTLSANVNCPIANVTFLTTTDLQPCLYLYNKKKQIAFYSVFLRHLIECLVDSGKTAEAASYAKVAEEFIKLHVPHLYPKLFLKQVRITLSTCLFYQLFLKLFQTHFYCIYFLICFSLIFLMLTFFSFLLQVEHKLKDRNALLKMCKQCNTLSVIYKIQEFKKWVNC